eukprot:10527963-Karenia_brevis.AAC.1
MRWTPAVQAKIASLPQSIQVLANAQFNEDELRQFLTNLTDEQIDEFCELWDHSKINNKHKITSLLMTEQNVKRVDDCCEIINSFLDQFKEKFSASYSADAIRDELAYQKRKR